MSEPKCPECKQQILERCITCRQSLREIHPDDVCRSCDQEVQIQPDFRRKRTRHGQRIVCNLCNKECETCPKCKQDLEEEPDEESDVDDDEGEDDDEDSQSEEDDEGSEYGDSQNDDDEVQPSLSKRHRLDN